MSNITNLWNFINSFEDYLKTGIKKEHEKFEFEKVNYEDKQIQTGEKVDNYDYFYNYLNLSDKRKKLSDLKKKATICSICNNANTKKKVLLLEEKIEAKIFVILDIFSNVENLNEKLFSTQELEFFTKWIEAINLKLDDVYITSIAKCVSVDDNNLENMSKLCFPFLEEEIRLIAPKTILILGERTAHLFLNKKDNIIKLQNSVFEFNSIPLFVTYNVSDVLQNASLKRDVWEKLKKIKKSIEE